MTALAITLALLGIAGALLLRGARAGELARLPEHVASPFVDDELPIGVLPGTVVAARTCERAQPYDYEHTTRYVVLDIRCDDVRWQGHVFDVWMYDGRARAVAKVLGADADDVASFVGKRGRFVYDVYGSRTVLAWGLGRCSLALDTYLHEMTPDEVREIDQSAGVLPLDEPEQPTVGLYR